MKPPKGVPLFRWRGHPSGHPSFRPREELAGGGESVFF
jgi:hypothetical protein